MATSVATSTTASSSSNLNLDKILDMKTTDGEIADLVDKLYSKDGSDADRSKFNVLFQQREERVTMLSNLQRALSDMRRAVIQNLRG